MIRRAFVVGLVSLVLVLQQFAFAGANFTIDISNFAFTPQSQTVPLGQSVQWHNTTQGVIGDQQATVHTATSDGFNDGTDITGIGLWNTGDIAAQAYHGISQFNAAGAFPYHCTHHTIM